MKQDRTAQAWTVSVAQTFPWALLTRIILATPLETEQQRGVGAGKATRRPLRSDDGHSDGGRREQGGGPLRTDVEDRPRCANIRFPEKQVLGTLIERVRQAPIMAWRSGMNRAALGRAGVPAAPSEMWEPPAQHLPKTSGSDPTRQGHLGTGQKVPHFPSAASTSAVGSQAVLRAEPEGRRGNRGGGGRFIPHTNV